MPCSSCSCLRSGQFAQSVSCCFAGTCLGALVILEPPATDHLRSLGSNSDACCHRLCFAAFFRADGLCRTPFNDTFGIFFAFPRTGRCWRLRAWRFRLGCARSVWRSKGGPQIRRGGHHVWRGSDLGFFDHYDALAGGKLGGGMVLAFAKAMEEFGVTIIHVANTPGQTQTLPLMIYAFLQVPGGMLPRFGLLVPSVFISVFTPARSEVQAYEAFLALNHSAGDVKLALAARFFR